MQDNFKPENLTSSNLQLKKSGFLVDYFIRPPISLRFKFEHEIWLSHIKLETQVGQQNSKGIDILIHDNNRVARAFLSQENSQKEVKAGKPSTKLLVRNVAFQATKQEITEIFKTYGELVAVRLPSKMSGSGSHRGFAFIEYTAKADAKAAMAELSGSTHLYGRRLVLEWAEAEESIDELRKRTADQFNAGSLSAPKRTKFEITVLKYIFLEAPMA